MQPVCGENNRRLWLTACSQNRSGPCSGGRIRTYDLWVMGPTSTPLLHTAIINWQKRGPEGSRTPVLTSQNKGKQFINTVPIFVLKFSAIPCNAYHYRDSVFYRRRKRDSNPRSTDRRTTVFKTAALDHSAISPEKVRHYHHLSLFRASPA